MRRIVILVYCLAGCAVATDKIAHDATDGNAPPIDTPIGGNCTMPKTGTLATWVFTGQPGDQAATPVMTTAPGVVATDVTRAPALTAIAAMNSINASNWPMPAQVDATAYFTFAITPPAGCVLDIASVSINALASGTGPTAAVIAASPDNFAHTAPVSTTAPSTPAITTVTAVTAKAELRVYGYSASSAAGTLRLQTTLSIVGTIR